MAEISESLAVAIQDPAAARQMGDMFRQQGKLAEAIACYRRAVELSPRDAETYNDLGVVLTDAGKMEEGIACYQQSVRLNPSLAQAHSNLGIAYREIGKLDEAVACHRAALQLRPDLAAIHNNLGNALRDQQKLDESIVCYRRAIELEAQFADAHRNLGNALRDEWQLDEAIQSHRRAIALAPNIPDAHNDLGVALRDRGNLEEEEQSLKVALALNPGFAEAHYNLGISLLLQGDYARGWAEYHWRCRMKRFQRQAVEQPLWNGDDLRGKTVLIYAEQGLGDTLHFVRYLPLVQQRAGRVIFQCQPALKELLQKCGGFDELVPADQPTPRFDTYAPLLSLPHLLGLPDPRNAPLPPYIAADFNLAAQWRAELDQLAGLRVGICWQGNPKHPADRVRSIPLSSFSPIAELPNICLVSLQKGHGSEQLRQFARRDAVVDLGPRLDEQKGAFMDTTAVIQCLDLVITADTAIAHLAGALGAPVWLLLSAVPDWRWLLKGELTAWYPSMRLFRQSRTLEWSDVFQRVKAELSVLALGPELS